MTFLGKEFRKWIECPECEGTGRCEYTVAVPDFGSPRGGELQGKVMECEVCDGIGELELDYDEDDEEEMLIIVQLENAGSIQ